MVDIIGESDIRKSLRTHTFGHSLYVFDKLDSTNQFAKNLAEKGVSEGTLIYSEHQTHGRGQWGKKWDSPNQKGLWFSLILKPDNGCGSPRLLTLLGAVSVATAIEKELQVKIEVRWPNDLFIFGKKVAGILAETVRSLKSEFCVILGIGINVNQKICDFNPEIKSRATSLYAVKHQTIARLPLFSKVITQLENDYFHMRKSGFDSLLSKWVTRSDVLGKEIIFQVNHHRVHGRVHGFFKNGDIVLVDPQGFKKRYSVGNIIEVKDDPCH